MKTNTPYFRKTGLLKIIIGILIFSFIAYHVAYEIGKFMAHIENT